MQQTTNYNLNLPGGTDIVNPLVDYNPNFSTIDGVMKANANRTVGRATCIKSGTTHVVTRSNTDSPIINFTATGDWNEGDTMTIDSTIVSVFLPDGTSALDGAYVINSEVFGILNGTRFTLYGSQQIPGYAASDISYDNTGSGLTATNVQTAIDEVNGKVDKGGIEVTADGQKTYAQLFNEIYLAISPANIRGTSYIKIGQTFYKVNSLSAYTFSETHSSGAQLITETIRLTDGIFYHNTISSGGALNIVDNGPVAPAIGTKISLVY